MATATPQRTGTAAAHDVTPSTGSVAPSWASPQSPATFAYGGPARASSSLLPSPPKEDNSRSRWTEHLEDTIVETEAPDEEEEETTATLGVPLPPAAAASLARIQRSSLPMPFELTDPTEHGPVEQDDTVRPDLGRAATARSVRIMQPAPAAQSPGYLQVPRQSYLAPESRGTTPMPIRPTSQLGLVTYGGRTRSPRFEVPGLDLKLTREPGRWARVQWRIGLPMFVFGPIVAQLFFDFCAVYTVIQAAAEPTNGQASSRRNWSLAAAAYCFCVLLWIVGVLIVYEAVYSFWRRWRVKRPLITPIYLSTPARRYASMASFDVYCFFRYVRRTAWDADAYEYTHDDRVMGRDGAEGRAGNRSKELLGAHSREASRSVVQSPEMREKEHRRSDSGGMLMQPRESEDWRAGEGRTSGVEGQGREGGMRRRSVGRASADEVRASVQLAEADKGHRRTPSGQTRFQELVRGPSRASSPRGKKSNHARRRSTSGRTSAEVERQLDIAVESRRASGSSSSSAAVGRVVSWVRALGHGQPQPRRETEAEAESVDTRRQWSADGLAEWFYARTQSAPTVFTLIPRAGISAAALFAFWNPQNARGTGAGVGVGGLRDGAFYRSNGTLTGFARGVLIANVAWILARTLLMLASLVGLWVLSGQICAGLCGPRYRWQEPLDEGEWDGEKEGYWTEPADSLSWEWRSAARERVQDAYELCMVRRRSASWRPPPPVSRTTTPGLIEGLDKGKGRERDTQTPRPPMDTYGSMMGEGIVRERNSDQELALSGLRDGRSVPVVEVTEHELGRVGGSSNGSRRGVLTADTFTPPGTGLVPPTNVPTITPAPGFVPLVPPVTPPVTTSVLPFPLHATTTGPVLPSPLVAAVRKGSESSAGRLTPPALTSTTGSRTTPSAPSTLAGSNPTSVSGSTPRGTSTATLVPMMTPRAGASRLGSVSASSRAGGSVLESEELEAEVEEQDEDAVSVHPGDQSGERSFAHSGSADQSYDSYAEGEGFSLDEYLPSQDGHDSGVRIQAPAAGSEADTSGSYSEGIEADTSASLSSLGQPISSRFFPISISRPGDRSSGSGSGGRRGSNVGSNVGSPVSSNNRSSGQGASERRRSSLFSHDDSLLSRNQDSIVSHLPRTPTSTLSRADDSIVSRGQQESIISSPSPSVRSGLIPPPPPNPNRRRRMTSPSGPSSSVDSLGFRRRVGSQPFDPAEFGPPPDTEELEAEQEDSVGMLSTPSSRKNSLAAIGTSRRGRVVSGSNSGSGSGSARSRAASAAYSTSVSGSGSGSGGSVQREDESERDYTFGIRPGTWRSSLTPARQSEESEQAASTSAEPPAHETGDEPDQR